MAVGSLQILEGIRPNTCLHAHCGKQDPPLYQIGEDTDVPVAFRMAISSTPTQVPLESRPPDGPLRHGTKACARAGCQLRPNLRLLS